MLKPSLREQGAASLRHDPRHPDLLHPGAIRGLVAWYDTARLIGVADGAGVGDLTDHSRHGNDAAQATGSAQPTYQTGEINGLPVLRFASASSQELSVDDAPGLDLNADGLTVFTVFSTSTMAGTIISKSPGASPLWRMQVTASGLLRVGYNDGTGYFVASSASVADGAPHLGVMRIKVGGLVEVMVDGVTVGSVAAGAAGFASSSTVDIGSLDSSDFFNGDLAEPAIYSRSLTNLELSRATQYFMRRYAL